MPEPQQPDRAMPSATAKSRVKSTWPGWTRPFAWWLGSLVLIVGLWSAAWFLMALQVKTAIHDWTEDTRAQGFAVGYHGYRIEGFPFELAATFDRPSLAAPNAGRPVVWEGDRLRLVAKPWDWSRVHMVASGPNRFGLHDGQAMRVYGGLIEGLEATARLSSGQLDRLDAVIKNADLSQDGGEARLQLAGMHLIVTQNNALTLRMKDLVLPDRVTRRWPLGPAISALSVQGAITGAPPRRLSQQALTQWRDAGGTIDIDTFRVVYGPLDLKASGTVALDATLQPVASLTTRWQGFFAFVDGLVAQGVLESRAALTAKLVLGVMAQASGNGGQSLNLPLSLKNRELQAGPVKLLTFNPISWPGERS